MLLTEELEINISGRDIKYYEGLGYKVPKYIDKQKRLKVKKGTIIIVKVKDIPRNSERHVKVECDYCNKEFNKDIKHYYRGREKIQKDCCDNPECIVKKQKEISLLTYGVDHYTKTEWGKDILNKVINSNKVITYDFIKAEFEKRGYKLISKEYIKNDEYLYYECPQHGIKKITWAHFNSGEGCNNCAIEKRIDGERWSQDYIESLFLERGYKVISKYINCKIPIQYICKKHPTKIRETSLLNFMNSKHCCSDCQKEIYIGENTPNWKGGITPENRKIRDSKEYKEWRYKVFERDNYTCQCCEDNKGGNLNAHHIENFSDNEDKRFDINNGITLCKNCHDFRIKGSFHNTYGTFNNSREQLEEYINNYKEKNKEVS